jgi:hypothetical protein
MLVTPQVLEQPRLRGVAAGVGWLLAAAGVAVATASFLDGWLRDGGAAYDFHSYYLAGQRVIAGEPLYTPVEINDPGAYRYLPTFAIVMAPLTIVPELALTWLYRVVCVLILRYLVGSWKAVGWALLFPPVLIELWSLNLTLPLAAGARWALRGSGAGAVPAQSVLKYSSVLLVPYLWLTRPTTRRALVIGAIGACIALGLHAVIDPASWSAFASSMVQQSSTENAAPYVGNQLLFIVPSTLVDFAIRFIIGIALVALAVRWRLGWLAFLAVIIAVPTLWLARLAPLVALPKLIAEDLASRRGMRPSP